MQYDVLDKHPEADLRVIAVWFDMVRGDDRSRWQPGLLTDSRVTHFWDTDKLVGTWYGENVTVQEPGHVEWDMFFLYDRGVEWSEDHSGLFSSGRTIWGRRDELSRDAATLLGASVDESQPRTRRARTDSET